MISRQCLKLGSPWRGLVFNKLLHAEVDTLRILCRCKGLQTSSLLSKNYAHTRTSCHIYATQIKMASQFTSKEGDLLEKFIAGLSADIFQKNRVYKNDFLRVLNKIKDLNFSTKKQGLLLIRCCSELLPDETPSSRMNLVEEVWNILKSHTSFEVDHYNELLKVYIANYRTLNVSKFLQQMDPVKPNIVTYELILKALGEAGDLNQASEVLSNMKAKGLPATESIFNSLIICQGVVGKPENSKEVLSMMRSLNIGNSVDTHTALARVYAHNKSNDKLLKELDNAKKNGIQFEERHIMDIVKTLAKVNNDFLVPDVLRYLPESTLKSPSISPYMQSVTTQLVFQNHPKIALEIYKCLPLPSFGPKDDPGLHGRGLVRDCVKASLPAGMIVLITQELMASGRNSIAIQNACEAALQLGKVPLALDLFTRMKQLGFPIRPHYFWPILIHSSKSCGEKGIMNTLQAMVKMEVKPDYDTFMDYTLPFVSFTSPQNLMKKFQEAGLSISSVLTPMMDTLLNMGQVRAASEICEIFQGKIDVDRILKSLLKGYFMSSDLTSTIHILEDCSQKASDKKKDWIGRFLCTFMQNKRAQHDLSDFINILKVLKKKNMKISTSAADYCLARLSDNHSKEVKDKVMDIIVVLTDESLVDEGEMFTQQMPHPRDMGETALKGHLSELEAKGMNTRGVLRKLLQVYCKNKDLQAAREIADKCAKEGVFLSAGMKAAIFDLHVKLGELELAEESLADLNKSAPNFTLDEFKIIDFATLLVFNKQIDRAMEMIKTQSKLRRITGGRNIAMNCWRLLDATSAHGSGIQIKLMFDLLTKLGYCNPTNSLLGPLVKVHMHRSNIDEAVKEFVRLANTYNKTPLKHELLCSILLAMGDGGNEENFLVNEKANGRMNKLAQVVLNVDKQVHGAGDIQLTLIAALAHVGYTKTLRKLLLDPTVQFHPDALLRRCERFADEANAKALLNIADCAKDLRRIDVQDVYELILDVYQRTNSYQDAMVLWNRMQENDVTPSQKFIKNLCSLLESQRRELPPDLSALLKKEEKKAQ